MSEQKSINIENKQLRGITVRNAIVTIISTASIVISIMTTYSQLKNDIKDVRAAQESQNRVNDIRLKILEDHVNLLDREINDVRNYQVRSNK